LGGVTITRVLAGVAGSKDRIERPSTDMPRGKDAYWEDCSRVMWALRFLVGETISSARGFRFFSCDLDRIRGVGPRRREFERGVVKMFSGAAESSLLKASDTAAANV